MAPATSTALLLSGLVLGILLTVYSLARPGEEDKRMAVAMPFLLLLAAVAAKYIGL